MAQWSPRQVHDTVAAIAEQPAYGHGARRSLLGRVFRYLIDRLADLFDAVRGSANARLILVLAIGAVVLMIVARIVVDRQFAEARHGRSDVRVRAGERTNFWSAAEESAQRGAFAEACHLVLAGVLDGLVRSGAVKWHASKTNGDYARELRRRNSPHYASFRAFAIDADRVLYGFHAPTNDDYVRLRDAGRRISTQRAAA
jgi:hypothetical protein